MDGPEASGPTATPSAGEIDKEKGTLRSRWHVWTRRGPRWLVTYGPNVDRRSVLSVSDEELGRSVPARCHVVGVVFAGIWRFGGRRRTFSPC